MKSFSMLMALFLALGCGGNDRNDPDDPNDPFDPFDPNDPNDPNDPGDGKTGKVTRCLGPSCPRGECGFNSDCSAYQGFDALDSSLLCGAATGAEEFCLKYEVPKDGGFVDIFEQVVSCADQTVVKMSCSAGCGYNYAPDDCAVCNGVDGCAFD